MSFSDKLISIDKLMMKINQHGTLPNKVLNKINYKFRLDWNYYSNSIEGNTLTMQETRSIMIGNVTINGKPVKDVMEMKGHDDVVNEILKIGKGELNISESRIRNIHKSIMHEEDPEKQKWIGKWKQQPNYLYNYKNERFDFTAPADVAVEMHKLINWLSKENEKLKRNDKTALHPVQIALKFNLDYITIHPFYDGNGRTSRILTNLILISYGYPPIYVKNNEKDSYYQYLGEIQGYGGSPDLFYIFMTDLLYRSVQITLDAIEGKDIEEQDDIDKELLLLKNAVKHKETTPPNTPKRPGTDELLSKFLGPLVTALHEKLKTVRELFSEFEEVVRLPYPENSGGRKGTKVSFERIIDSYKSKYVGKSNIHIILAWEKEELSGDTLEIMLYYNRLENVNENLSLAFHIPFSFKKYSYNSYDLENKELFSKTYDQEFTASEIEMMVKLYVRKVIEEIKAATDIN
jgi:Fic family protein